MAALGLGPRISPATGGAACGAAVGAIHNHRPNTAALAVTLCCCIVTPASAQAPFDAVQASAGITHDLARQDVDAAADAASKLMEATPQAKLKDVFRLVRDLGRAKYTDLVYARDYGRTEKDVIYKIDFEKAFLFARYLYQIDNGAWRLIHVDLKTENTLPFPREWVHIYPQ